MLHHPTLEKLNVLKLTGMSRALAEQESFPDIGQLGFEERLGLLADRELTERGNRRLALKLRFAKLRQAAAIEDLDFRSARGIDKALVANLASCQWVHEHLNVLICGPKRAEEADVPSNVAKSASIMAMTCFANSTGLPFRRRVVRIDN